MRIKKKYLYYIFVAIFGFLISLNLLQNYIYGDQISYRKFYDHVAGLSFLDSIQASLDILTASEPVSILILWTGSNLGVQKDIWISFLNILLILGLFALLIRHKASWHVGVLIFGNYYFLVLITAAERLKISYIMVVYAFLIGPNIKKFLFLFLALLSHFQTIIFLAGLMFFSLSEQKLKFNKKFKIKKTFSIILFLSITVFILFALILRYNYKSNASKETNENNKEKNIFIYINTTIASSTAAAAAAASINHLISDRFRNYKIQLFIMFII